MKPKKVWIAKAARRQSRYAWKVLGGTLGITAVVIGLTAGGTLLTIYCGWPMEITLLFLCLGTTVLGVWLALKLRRQAFRESVVFFLTEEDRLFQLQTSMTSWHGGGPLGYAAGALGTQRTLNELARYPTVPDTASEILQVNTIKKNRDGYAVRCVMRLPGGPVAERTCVLVHGLPEEDLLLRELERRQDWHGDLEPMGPRHGTAVAVSAAALAVLGGLCGASHPAVGRLPQSLYFPCLAAAFAALVGLVYFAVRRYRGE